MEIGKQRQTFLNLLAALPSTEEGEVRISDKVLVEHGLGDRTFFEAVCPGLLKQGVLKKFNDPDAPISDFTAFCTEDSTYRHLMLARYPSLRGNNSWANDYPPYAEEFDAKMEKRRRKLRARYKHVFVKDMTKVKVKVCFDRTKGIYREDGVGKRYPITGMRWKFVFTLLGTDVLSLKDAFPAYWGDGSQVSHNIADINKICREKLLLQHDLIINEPTAGGYLLNREMFDIEEVKAFEVAK